MTEAEIQLVNAVKAVADTDSGKKLLDYLSDFCFEKRNTFVCNPNYGDGLNNIATQNIRNGRRSVIIRIRELLETDLNKLPEPEQEQEEERNYI